MNKKFSDFAWEDYAYWLACDKKVAKKINALLRDIDRNGHDGMGNPEPLRHELAGYWSRRITEKDRLIYKIVEDTIFIISCKGHYD